jgi:hypothetical protein
MFTTISKLRHRLLLGTAIAALTAGCAPSAAQQQATATAIAATVIAQITAAAPTQTPTPVATQTRTPAPTKTPGPTRTPKPTKTIGPTATPRPTRTPVPGTFRNPIAIGQSGTTRSEFYEADMTLTVLEVIRGKDAIRIAQRLQSLLYTAPIEKQEYLLVKVKIQWMKGPLTTKITMMNSGVDGFALRYVDGGEDLYTAWVDRLVKGYIPLEGEGWIQFLVREGSQPLLYVQPELAVYQELRKDTNTGLYFSLVP